MTIRRLEPRAILSAANGKRCSITRAGAEGYVLFADGEQIAEHWSPRWLSDSALGSGALEVRWEFDLKEAEQ